MEEHLRLHDHLSVPYVLEAETVELAQGSWIRRVGYPELPGCTAESVVLEDALRLLERNRIELIVRMVGEDRPPPVPRPPLQDCDPVGLAQQFGLSGEIMVLIADDKETAAAKTKTNY
jgi:hypothetical protein